MRRIVALASAAALAACSEEQAFRIVAPGGTTYTNASVSVTVETGTLVVERVELLVDGSGIGSLDAPPWTWVVDTRGLAEGAHALRAHALTAAGTGLLTEPVTIVVDRTPPKAWFEPLPGYSLFPGRPLDVVFDEPVELLDPTRLRLLSGAVPVAATVTPLGERIRVVPPSLPVGPVSLTLDGTIADRAGNAFVGTLGWRGWSYPFTPVARVALSWMACAAASPAGHGLAAWTGEEPGDALAAHATAESDWTLASAAGAWSCSAAATPDGALLLATAPPLRVQRWAGGSLVPFGAAVAPQGAPALGVDPSGVPILAWADGTYPGTLHVATWDAAPGEFVETLPALALPDGEWPAGVAGDASAPMVLVAKGYPIYATTLYQWSGAAWIPTPLPDGQAEHLVAGPGGAPLAVQLRYGSPRLFLWDGAAWQEPWPAPAIQIALAATVDGSGRPIVLHVDPVAGTGLLRHDGVSWVAAVPTGALAGSSVTFGDVAAGPGSTALVAWSESGQTLDFARWVSW